MSNRSRRSVLVAVAAALATPGCTGLLDDGDGTPTRSPPGASESTDERTTDTSAGPSRTTSDPIRAKMHEPEPDHAIYLHNETDRSTRMYVRVTRATSGETVFETTAPVSAGATRTVYNLREANPIGVEEFVIYGAVTGSEATATVTGSPSSTETERGSPSESRTESPLRARRTVRTSACYGHVHVTRFEGSLEITHSIC